MPLAYTLLDDLRRASSDACMRALGRKTDFYARIGVPVAERREEEVFIHFEDEEVEGERVVDAVIYENKKLPEPPSKD